MPEHLEILSAIFTTLLVCPCLHLKQIRMISVPVCDLYYSQQDQVMPNKSYLHACIRASGSATCLSSAQCSVSTWRFFLLPFSQHCWFRQMSLTAPQTDKDDFCPCFRLTLFPTGPFGFADSDDPANACDSLVLIMSSGANIQFC